MLSHGPARGSGVAPAPALRHRWRPAWCVDRPAQPIGLPSAIQGADSDDAPAVQKQLRLFKARRLLASGETNVETAAFRVGYESPSQFSREYARMFGTSPRRDVASLRQFAA